MCVCVYTYIYTYNITDHDVKCICNSESKSNLINRKQPPRFASRPMQGQVWPLSVSPASGTPAVPHSHQMLFSENETLEAQEGD